jgi:hypothetical protein
VLSKRILLLRLHALLRLHLFSASLSRPLQTQEVIRMRDAVLDYSLNEKNDKLASLKKVADDIFVPNSTMKLSLLGKAWGYDALYESCKARIVADPLPHVSSQLWKSPSLMKCTWRVHFFSFSPASYVLF